MDSHSKDALFVRGRPKERDTNNSSRVGNLNLKVGHPQKILKEMLEMWKSWAL
jgi:hypothetical protein